MITFIPTYLYIKEHTETGLKYFGKTINDPIKYTGSGKYWLRHINQHGKDKIITPWYQLFTNKDSLIEYATKFSIENNIIESIEWANLDIETGLNGGARLNNALVKFNKDPRSAKWRNSQSKSQPKHIKYYKYDK